MTRPIAGSLDSHNYTTGPGEEKPKGTPTALQKFIGSRPQTNKKVTKNKKYRNHRINFIRIQWQIYGRHTSLKGDTQPFVALLACFK